MSAEEVFRLEDALRISHAEIDELRSLVGRLADDEPLTTSSEGLDDGCFFCGADALSEVRSDGLVIFAEHRTDCAWVEARRALGLGIGEHTCCAEALS
jgi:hypothetical protein